MCNNDENLNKGIMVYRGGISARIHELLFQSFWSDTSCALLDWLQMKGKNLIEAFLPNSFMNSCKELGKIARNGTS